MSDEVEQEPAETWLTMHEVFDLSGLSYRELQEQVEQGTIRARQAGGATLYCGEDLADEGR